MVLFIMNTRLCRGFSLTLVLRTRPLLFRFFFSVHLSKVCRADYVSLCAHEMEFKSMPLFPCSHSKSSFESQFLESQGLFFLTETTSIHDFQVSHKDLVHSVARCLVVLFQIHLSSSHVCFMGKFPPDML